MIKIISVASKFYVHYKLLLHIKAHSNCRFKFWHASSELIFLSQL